MFFVERASECLLIKVARVHQLLLDCRCGGVQPEGGAAGSVDVGVRGGQCGGRR